MHPYRRVPGAIRIVAVCVALVAASACATPPALTPSPSPTAHHDAAGWQTADVEQPSTITDAPSDAPVFCSPCHPDVNTYITSIVNVRQSYVAFGYLAPPAEAAAWISDTGAKWKRIQDFPGLEGTLVLAAVGDAGGVVAVGADGKGAVSWRSLTGTSWASAPMPLPAADAGAGSRATAVTRTATGYVAGGYTERAGARRPIFWRSLNGSEWKPIEAPTGTGSEQVTGMAAAGGTVLAVGIAGDEQTGTSAVWLSGDDGVSWQRISSAAFAAGRMLAATDEGSGYVAVGEAAAGTAAAAWTSFDGKHWDAAPQQAALQNDGQKAVMTAVANAGTYVVAVGWESSAGNGSAAAWRSSDGRSWQRIPPAVSFLGGGMAAVNADSGIVAAGTTGWPDVHAAQVWLLPQ